MSSTTSGPAAPILTETGVTFRNLYKHGRLDPYEDPRLPFELTSSMEAVKKQKEDLPYDSENPTFPFGYGLTY
jgi:hypothetical protein